MPGVTAAEHFKVGFDKEASVPEHGPNSRALANKVHSQLHDAGLKPDEINRVEGSVAKLINHNVAEQRKNAFEAGKQEAPAAETKMSKPWMAAGIIMSAAVTALIVWAIMHSKDKKLKASLAAANSSQSGN